MPIYFTYSFFLTVDKLFLLENNYLHELVSCVKEKHKINFTIFLCS